MYIQIFNFGAHYFEKPGMDRKQFLSAIGLSSAALALACTGCSKTASGGDVVPTPSNVDFTLDLTAAENSALNKPGGYLAVNSIIVAHTISGTYIAVQQSCTHQNYPLNYDSNNRIFFCNNHGASFNENGAVTGGPTNRSLVTFKTALTGSSLRVFS